jgi:eukaryotic-like serine/threonine-protein kinase
MIGQSLGHYRIVEKIGAGGMGEVYRAHDDQLDRDVALKVLPVGMLADDAARKRFRKEALALAKLNHPNIETVHEFGTQGGVDFLAMELISGSSLSSKLQEAPLPEKETARLGMQFAEGLAAAHEQGVVHRDLKPGNLMITPDGRLKILDFGLAQLLHPTQDLEATRSITIETGTVSGTVPYMPPEQLRGEPCDARADIYAAGAVLYEMATGQRPFPQTQGPQLIGAILHQEPAAPRSLNPDISSGLERVILKALVKERTQRFQSAREFLGVLEGLNAGAAHVAARKHPVRLPALAGAGALTIVLLIGLVFGLNLGGLRQRLLHRSSPEGAGMGLPSGPIHARRSVAVLGFKNLAGRQDEAWLSTALSEMLTTELAAGGALRTISGENVAQMKASLALPDADSYSAETLKRIRANIGSDDVVLGSYLALGNGQVRVDLRLENASTGEIVDSVTQTGKEADVADLVSRTGENLRQKLGAGAVTVNEAAAVKASLPSNPQAARFYAEGLAKLRTWDNLAARDLLQKAVAGEPTFALAHSGLAKAWSGLGYDEKAKQEAKKAFDLSAALAEEDRLSVEGQYREITRDWGKAVEIYRKLFDFFPDNLDYGLRLANSLDSAGKEREALATVDALRKLPSPASEDPRIDMQEGWAALGLGDRKRAMAAAEKSAAKADAEGAKLIVASALMLQCTASQDVGTPEQTINLCDEGKRLYAEAGDRHGVAKLLDRTAWVLAMQGDLDSAQTKAEEALSVFREVGDKLGMAGALNTRATVLLIRNDYAGASKGYEQMLAIDRELDNTFGQGTALLNLGIALSGHGDLAAASRALEQATVLEREIGDREGQAYLLIIIAGVETNRGNLDGAKKMLTEAQSILSDTGSKRFSGDAHAYLGGVLEAQGALSGARAEFQEALHLQQAIGNKSEAAGAKVSLADLSVEEGHAQDAETLVREALAEFQAEKASEQGMYAEAVLARALLGQGKLGDAQREIDNVLAPARKSQNPDARMEVATVAARVLAASGKSDEAEKKLEATIAEAVKTGFVPDDFEARLALGEIEIKSGKAAAGGTRLAVLEKDATTKGFLLIARKARAAAKR